MCHRKKIHYIARLVNKDSISYLLPKIVDRKNTKNTNDDSGTTTPLINTKQEGWVCIVYILISAWRRAHNWFITWLNGHLFQVNQVSGRL